MLSLLPLKQWAATRHWTIYRVCSFSFLGFGILTTCTKLLTDRAVVSEEDLWNGGITYHRMSIYLSGGFAAFALLMSFYLMIRHATHYSVPTEQRLLVMMSSLGSMGVADHLAASSAFYSWSPCTPSSHSSASTSTGSTSILRFCAIATSPLLLPPSSRCSVITLLRICIRKRSIFGALSQSSGFVRSIGSGNAAVVIGGVGEFRAVG